jgi:hypothetical protein
MSNHFRLRERYFSLAVLSSPMPDLIATTHVSISEIQDSSISVFKKDSGR